ncbi:MAG TPA: Flp family type IVb pilin [Gaiellaceae bacterium]|nr:Flp family type IVb pilin [Gaiellaceae bacterium]
MKRLFVAAAARTAEDEGQTFVEYALILTLVSIAIAVLAAWTNLGNGITSAMNTVVSHL